MATVTREPGRATLDGVQRISWGTGEMCEFASALVSAVKALGEEIPYHLVMGASGAAFRLTLNTSIWDPGSYGIRCVSADPDAPIRRAFEAIGREFTLCEMGTEEQDAAAIMASIDTGVPVLAFGVVGPADCSLIAGYDQGGKTLLGWSTYQDIPDDHNVPPDAATGYFRKPEWHANTRGYVLLGGQAERPPLRRATLDALRWAVEVVRQSRVREMPAGLGAYGIWADEMVEDRHFAEGDVGALGGPYLGILCILMMVDDRRAAVDFLGAAAADAPDLAPELQAAADSYRKTCELRSGLSELLREDFSEGAIRSLARADLRREYAGAIRKMHDQDAEAIGHIERCVARI